MVPVPVSYIQIFGMYRLYLHLGESAGGVLSSCRRRALRCGACAIQADAARIQDLHCRGRDLLDVLEAQECVEGWVHIGCCCVTLTLATSAYFQDRQEQAQGILCLLYFTAEPHLESSNVGTPLGGGLAAAGEESEDLCT